MNGKDVGTLVDLTSLRAHRAALQHDEEGWFVWGALEALWAEGFLDRGKSERLDELKWHLRAVLNRLGGLRTIAAKLDWMLGERDAGNLAPDGWMHFASNDVLSFFSELRSLFDHLAAALAAAAPQPGGVPDRSFNRLRNWLSKDPQERGAQLGGEIADVIRSCEWFDEVREVRDGLLHRDATTIVFPDEPGVRFQVYQGADRLIEERGVLIRENIVSFERFAAAVMARLHSLLEAATISMAELMNVDLQETGPGWSRHFGLEVIAQWTDEYLGMMDET